jgi:hypothetical protein
VLLLGVFVAYTKLGDLVNIELPRRLRAGVLMIVTVWAEVVLDFRRWEEIERRGQTHAPMPAVAPLDPRPGAAGRELRPGLRAGRERRPPPSAAVRGNQSAGPTVSRTRARDRRRHPYIPANVIQCSPSSSSASEVVHHHPGGVEGLARPPAPALLVFSPGSWCHVQAGLGFRHAADDPVRRS